MRKFIIILGIVVLSLLLLVIRDYNNYFYGKSIMNYHALPYGLTPDYYKHYDIENGQRIAIEEFNLITPCSEFVGGGCPIPMDSPSTFTIDTIKTAFMYFVLMKRTSHIGLYQQERRMVGWFLMK